MTHCMSAVTILFMEYRIVLIKVEKRTDAAADVQKILTDYGCSISVRLGLHDEPAGSCSPSGLIFLQVSGGQEPVEKMVEELNELDNVTAKYLTI